MNKFRVGFLGDSGTLHARLLTEDEAYLTNIPRGTGTVLVWRPSPLGTGFWSPESEVKLVGDRFPYGWPVEDP